MTLRAFRDEDLPALVELTIATFGPFYEGWVRGHYGETVFAHQHGDWQGDYRREVPTLHEPTEGRHVVVAEQGGSDGRVIVGYAAWRVDASRPAGQRHGDLHVLAVAADHRGAGLGTALCEHVFDAMRADGVEVVGIGTGGDDFHAPARALYERLGMIPVPITGYLMAL